MNRLAREYGANPHGDAEWELGAQTSKELTFTTAEFGGATPVLQFKLPARPKDKKQKVKKQTFIFHFTIKDLW